MGKLGKHDHKLTNLLKGGIFSLIMLAPLIAIGVKCLYVVNNKNAYESYYGETINEENLEKVNELLPNNTYIFANTEQLTGTAINTARTDMVVSNVKANNTEYPTVNVIRMYWYNTGYAYFNLMNGTDTVISYNLANQYINVEFQYNSRDNNNYITAYDYWNKKIYNDYSYLDNVFYYSIQELEKQSTFNWVQNTAIYTPLNAMCSGLGITESAIPILLCYWSLMTAIYIVFDIIIYLFTKMTHFIGTN